MGHVNTIVWNITASTTHSVHIELIVIVHKKNIYLMMNGWTQPQVVYVSSYVRNIPENNFIIFKFDDLKRESSTTSVYWIMTKQRHFDHLIQKVEFQRLLQIWELKGVLL